MARMNAESRLSELGIELPTPQPGGRDVRGRRAHGKPGVPVGRRSLPAPDGTLNVTGKVGLDEGGTVSIEEARHAARLTGLQLLTKLRAEVGSLDRVVRIVKVLGMVNPAPGFNRTPTVIDGCSELFVEVFGEAGRGARSAVGMAELPFDIAVEIEAIVEVDPLD